MDDSMGAGLMAVIAVSGSIVFLSLQVHKRLLSDFMHKIEFELGSGKDETKKRVSTSPLQMKNRKGEFYQIKNAKTVSCSSCGGSRVVKDYSKHGLMEEGSMPRNWQALYKGMLQYRKLSTPCI
ncbi:hypothetical protein DCAR_0310269 [Daucus carota subsp. sativus]|uniref:Uncharacterized protein n=1 Tax=Daucus carota subsp. sativus TaxID=79200 RepID=A0AAF1ASR6_DAUCS|nr:hypothetical protein DCAR_0310269 [Daucus carota subsp. sativus]